MNIDKIADIVMLELGGRHVNIEITLEDIKLLIEVSLRKACSMCNHTEFKEVQALPCQKFDAATVIRVFDNTISTSTTSDIDDVFSIYALLNRDLSMNNLKNSLIYNAYSSFSKSAITKSYKYEGNNLYLYNYSGQVTVEYIPKTIDISNLDDTLIDWVIRYTKCLCKEVLGRVRGKFKSSSSPFEVDSENLLSEYNDEKTTLIDELSNYGFYFISTD